MGFGRSLLVNTKPQRSGCLGVATQAEIEAGKSLKVGVGCKAAVAGAEVALRKLWQLSFSLAAQILTC